MAQLQQILPQWQNPTVAKHEELQSVAPRAMTEVELAKLPELLVKLRSEEENNWSNLCQTQIRRDLLKFAQRLQQWGEEYCYSPLLDYSSTLIKQIEEFDLDRFPITLEAFPETIRELETLINEQ